MATGTEPLVIEARPSFQHTHTVILLHGRDSTNIEFASEIFESEGSEIEGRQKRTLPDLLPGVRWVFPTAPRLRSTRFNTMMSQWFDIWSVEDPELLVDLQADGLKQSVAALLGIIRHEETIVARKNIFLGGISQGFATSLAAFFADGKGLAGLVGFCSWMPFASAVENIALSNPEQEDVFQKVQAIYHGESSAGRDIVTAALKSTPIFLGHALDDDVVPINNARRMREVLEDRLCLTVFFHEYPDGSHWLNEPRGMDGIVDFISLHMNTEK